MDRYDFTQPGGFPFDQGVMKFIQDCISSAAQSAALSGPFAILSGCVVTGPSVADGWVTINGEILPFQGGLAQAKVVTSETATSVAFQDGTPRVVKYVRIAKFGDDGGVTNYQWVNFKRNTAEGVLARLDRVEGLLRPFSGAGGMVWWKGAIADIPTGWREVTAWRGRLPMAYDPTDADFAINNANGAKTHTLIAAEIPEFDLVVQTTGYAGIGGNGNRLVGHSATPAAGDLHFTINAGGGAAHNILNPYRVGCWIEPIPGTF